MKLLLSLIGALALIVALASAAYFFGGFYNVAASEHDPDILVSALRNVRNDSISRHATDTPPANLKLDDPETVKAGARAFAARGCPFCHGAPGVDYAKLTEGMNPGPPDLKTEDEVKALKAAEVFWIVKNGIRMTGMPAASGGGVPDPEIWQIAAFVKKLPEISDDDFKAWTAK